MTELIIALDGPQPLVTQSLILSERIDCWFKIKTRTLRYHYLQQFLGGTLKIFLDTKMADTKHEVAEDIKALADIGTGAVSTFTDSATEAAVQAAEGTPLKVWRILSLTDDPKPRTSRSEWLGEHGLIMPGISAPFLTHFCKEKGLDLIIPGVRMQPDINLDNIGAPWFSEAKNCKLATHVVVGRPIWQSENPIEAAKRFLEELNG